MGSIAVMLVLIILTSIPGWAQSTTSTVGGIVTDRTGAAVFGATITVVNIATGVAYHTTSDDRGAYRVSQLPPGNYTLKVASSGFATQESQIFPVVVDQQVQQNLTLEVGSTTQTVTVSAGALLLDPENSNQGQVIENKKIDDMPLNGRDYLQLAQLSAGVTPIIAGMNSPASQWSGPTTVAIAIAGLREDDASYLYDGVETRNSWYGGAGLLPSLDNIQEFKVEQSGSSAAYGGGGAFVNVVTRSGTNQYHGTAYEFVRNNAFDARNYFDEGPAPPFHQNQFGASFGGPIKKNKMFFFVNYEGFRQIRPTDQFYNVPTAQQRAGDFSADTGPIVNPFNNYQPFPGNQIPSQLFNSIGQKILNLYPAPNGSFSGGVNYFDVANTTNNWDQENVRFDYAISGKDSIFVRFTNQNQSTSVTDITPSMEIIYPSYPKNLAIGWTHIFSSNIINNLRYGWSHTEVGVKRADGYDSTKNNPLGLINADAAPGSFGPPSLFVTNYANPGSLEGTQYIREGLNMVTESLMFQKGKHQITAGLDVRYRPIYLYEDWAAPSINFNGSYTNDPIADVLLGIPVSSFAALGNPLENFRMWSQAYYIQDNWRLNHRLSVNLGGRWEYTQQPVETANRVGSFNIATGQDLTFPDTKSIGLGRAMVKPVYTNFSPRVGFNLSPFANGNTVVKGGFGIYYLQANTDQYQVEVDTTKLYLIQGYDNSSVGQPIGFTLDQLYGPGVPGSGPLISFIDPHAKTPYTYEWNLSVEHTLRNWLLEVAYVGSAAHHFEERPNIDPLNPDGTSRYPQYSGVQENTESGSSIYNGVIGRVEKRYSSGFSLLASYTFSKCLGWPWQDVFAWHPLNMRLDRGHCYTDLNHNFVASGDYELPFGRGKAFLNSGGVANAILGGWKVALIASIHSGPWETLSSPQDLGTFVNGLPNVTGPVNNSALHGGLGKNGKLGPYFNVQNVQVVNDLGVQGNASVQSVEAPGGSTWDISGSKEWKYADRYSLTFRTDFFNAFNKANFNGLDTGVADSRFGFVTGAGAAREIQFSLRAAF